MFECFHCGEVAVIWECDYDAEDCGYLEPGIVQQLHCSHCNAEIQYFIPIKKEDKNGTETDEE